MSEKFRDSIYNTDFGVWASYPVILSKLLKYKILITSEYLVLQYIILELSRSNKWSGQFSKRHLSNELSIGDNTAWRALTKLCALGLLRASSERSVYGQTYTLDKVVLEQFSEQLGLWATGTPLCSTMTPEWATGTPEWATGTPEWATTTPNKIVFNKIYTLYIKNQSPEHEAKFILDCEKLIQSGFTTVHIRTFLELHSKNDFLYKIQSFYAVIRKFGKKALDEAEASMTLARREREERRAMNEKRLQAVKDAQQSIKPSGTTTNNINNGKPSFKLDQ
jgi:hypothetical protein